MLLFPRKATKNEKKLEFIDKMVARSFLSDIKYLSIDTSQAHEVMKLHKAKIREQLSSRRLQFEEQTFDDKVTGDLKSRMMMTMETQSFEIEEFKKQIEPNASEAQASARALFLRYNKNPAN